MREPTRAHPTIAGPSAVDSRPAWRQLDVDGHTAAYGVAGRGRRVLFLHGFGLSHRIYAGAIERLAATGVRVYAPALPGFGGTRELTGPADFEGYARWVGRFLDAAGIDEPVTTIGHSFGGGVALATAHHLSERVSQLVLVNSVGGGAWAPDGSVREIGHRPLWRWGASAAMDTVLTGTPISAIASITSDALRNVARSPAAVWRIGHLVRAADLRAEAVSLAERGVPATLLWSTGDTFIPRASFEALRSALSDPSVHSVDGCHGWLIGNPDAFGRAVTEILG